MKKNSLVPVRGKACWITDLEGYPYAVDIDGGADGHWQILLPREMLKR